MKIQVCDLNSKQVNAKLLKKHLYDNKFKAIALHHNQLQAKIVFEDTVNSLKLEIIGFTKEVVQLAKEMGCALNTRKLNAALYLF